jgi:hypothetical protein
MIARHVIASLLLSPRFIAVEGWWNKDWTHRQKITINTAPMPRSSPVRLRMPWCWFACMRQFQFANAAADGSDLRVVTDDGTVLRMRSRVRWLGRWRLHLGEGPIAGGWKHHY